jgi:hypothetical protein
LLRERTIIARIARPGIASSKRLGRHRYVTAPPVGWRLVVADGCCDGGWFGEVAVVGLVFDHFVDESAVGVGVAEQVLEGGVPLGEGAGLVVADGDGLLVGEVGRDPASQLGIVDGLLEDCAAQEVEGVGVHEGALSRRMRRARFSWCWPVRHRW